MILLLGLGVVALAIVAVARGVDVRLALLTAALTLGVLAGRPAAILRTFLITLADEKFVVPICCAMGFAYVLRLTGCDQHLVHLLVEPVRRVRAFLIPGTVLVGFCVNIPIISQTSTAVTIGPVLIPLLRAARIRPVIIGAALLLGSSIGGELLNPGAPELRTVVEETQKAVRPAGSADGKPGKGEQRPVVVRTSQECVSRILPLILVELVVAGAVFWIWTAFREGRQGDKETGRQGDGEKEGAGPGEGAAFQVNYLKALVPVVPLVLLFLTARPFELLPVPREWLVVRPDNPDDMLRFDSRLIGAAMLVGVGVAALTAPRTAPQVARSFFEGTGYAFTNIISLIVTASCLGEGVKLVGFADLVGEMVRAAPGLLIPAAGLLPFGFAVLCGSGMAATQSLFGFFARPALALGIDPAHVGAVVAVAGAAGRTASPVAAVTLMCSAMTQTDPVRLARQVVVPLVIGGIVMVIVAGVLASAAGLVYSG